MDNIDERKDGREHIGVKGTSDSDGFQHVETVLSVAENREVNSNDGMELFDMFGSAKSVKCIYNKRFKICQAPEDPTTCERGCFSLIGAGSAFCTSNRCSVTHRGRAVKLVNPGDLYITKSSSEAFVDPNLEAFSSVDEAVLSNWKSLSLTFDECSEKFVTAAAACNEAPAIEVQENFYWTQALSFKTPAKCKRVSSDEEPELLLAAPYSPLIGDDNIAEFVMSDLNQVADAMSQLDQGVLNTNGTLIALLDDYRDQLDKASVAISSYWFRLESLTALLGSRPAALPQDILTPSAWGSIGLLANKMTQLAADVIPQMELTKLLETCETSYFDFDNEKIGMAAIKRPNMESVRHRKQS
jgi:hypothetical protein